MLIHPNLATQEELKMSKHIVLIAPRGIPLESWAKTFAEKLNLPFHSPNDFSDEEWKALGFSMKTEFISFAKGGAYEAYRQKVPLRIAAVKKLLSNPSPSIIALPPDYVVYENPQDLLQVFELVDESARIILLTPTNDENENAKILDADLSKMTDWSEVNAYWVRHPANEKLAKHRVYTAGKTEDETCAEIIQLAEKASDIILIGPKLTGKTTLGFLLSEALGLPQVSLDNIGWDYLEDTDYDFDLARQKFLEGGIFAWLAYMRKYEAHMVERTFANHKNCVIDFGGGHSVYDEGEYFDKVAAILAPYPNVFLVLPAADKDESIRILAERWQKDIASERKLQRLFVTHPSFSRLADEIIYTKSKDESALLAELEKIVS
jgi:shikimate kinase